MLSHYNTIKTKNKPIGMKNIEKIAIDSTLSTLGTAVSAEVVQLSEYKKQFEAAKKNFQQAANELMAKAKASTKEIAEELSEEGVAFLEAELSNLLTIPFKLK